MKDIWNSKLANDIRESILRGELHPTCGMSQNCPYLVCDRIPQKTQWMQMPDELELDLPNQHCNIGGENPSPQHPACLMCSRHKHFERQGDRLDEICTLFSSYMKHLRIIHIQGVAEPFWKDRIFEILNNLNFWPYAKQIRLTTYTNGTILNEKRIKKFMRVPNHNLTFSIDAATPETYKKIRRINAFDKVVENLMICSELCQRGKQYLQIHNNINTINLGEVVGMVELAAKARVSYIDFNPTYLTDGICVNKDNVHLFKQAEKEIREAAKKLKISVAFMRESLTLDFEREAISLI